MQSPHKLRIYKAASKKLQVDVRRVREVDTGEQLAAMMGVFAGENGEIPSPHLSITMESGKDDGGLPVGGWRTTRNV